MNRSEDDVKQRLEAQRARIARAARAVGRDPQEIRLIAVSKKQPSASIRAAYAAGQRDFGENYVQELVEKAEQLKDLPDITWHMIGHLQSNKVRQLVGVVGCVHTVSSVKLARELGKRVLQSAPGGGSPLPVLVEVNVGGEEAKSGCAEEELGEILQAIDAESALRCTGLMTIPPATDDPEGARPYFEQLRTLRDAHGGREHLPHLSMGMSHDVEQAIFAGATYVRIGTAIFGERPPR